LVDRNGYSNIHLKQAHLYASICQLSVNYKEHVLGEKYKLT